MVRHVYMSLGFERLRTLPGRFTPGNDPVRSVSYRGRVGPQSPSEWVREVSPMLRTSATNDKMSFGCSSERDDWVEGSRGFFRSTRLSVQKYMLSICKY